MHGQDTLSMFPWTIKSRCQLQSSESETDGTQSLKSIDTIIITVQCHVAYVAESYIVSRLIDDVSAVRDSFVPRDRTARRDLFTE